MIEKLTALIRELRKTLSNAKDYIIIVQLILGGLSFVLAYQIWKGKNAEISTLTAEVKTLNGQLDKKNTFILEVLVGLNARANQLLDTALAENKRK